MAEEIAKIELNPNLTKELHSFPDVQSATLEIAERIAEEARLSAPAVTGRYRDGIKVDKPTKSGVARVISTDQKSAWVEFGNGHQDGQFIFRNAVEALGLKFKKGRG